MRAMWSKIRTTIAQRQPTTDTAFKQASRRVSHFLSVIRREESTRSPHRRTTSEEARLWAQESVRTANHGNKCSRIP
jgi:hypothetical protein